MENISIECNKCDDNGSIVEHHKSYSTSHSCKCGKYGIYMKKKFDDMFGGDPNIALENLLAYGRNRITEKQSHGK